MSAGEGFSPSERRRTSNALSVVEDNPDALTNRNPLLRLGFFVYFGEIRFLLICRVVIRYLHEMLLTFAISLAIFVKETIHRT